MSDNTSEAIDEVAEVLFGASLPIDPDLIEDAAEQIINFYAAAKRKIRLPANEVASRFSELYDYWFHGGDEPSEELQNVIYEAISVDSDMNSLAKEYFKLEAKLEKKSFMPRTHAVSLIGCAPLIKTLITDHHLGLDRIRAVLGVPGTTHDTLKDVLNAIGIKPAFNVDDIQSIHKHDIEDVSSYFGDIEPDKADSTYKSLLGTFSQCETFWENVVELIEIGFEPYLFMLYYELLTLERTDRFPGRGIYECSPRSQQVKELWNNMYKPEQQCPYLNNAKSVFSLDEDWAVTKLSPSTQNGSILLAEVFKIMAELPYTARRKVAHITRCYLVLVANKKRQVTPLEPITSDAIKAFMKTVAHSNSSTRGVLDQRLADFLTKSKHPDEQWVVRGLGSSVNESNVSGHKYGDVEYLKIDDRQTLHAYEAHGGSLRDEYVADHIRSLHSIVLYCAAEAADRGEEYMRDVSITYVAHDISRLEEFFNSYSLIIEGIPFSLRFITYNDLVLEAGGIDAVAQQTDLFNSLIHSRISRLPDAYPLKTKYQAILAGQ